MRTYNIIWYKLAWCNILSYNKIWYNMIDNKIQYNTHNISLVQYMYIYIMLYRIDTIYVYIYIHVHNIYIYIEWSIIKLQWHTHTHICLIKTYLYTFFVLCYLTSHMFCSHGPDLGFDPWIGLWSLADCFKDLKRQTIAPWKPRISWRLRGINGMVASQYDNIWVCLKMGNTPKIAICGGPWWSNMTF